MITMEKFLKKVYGKKNSKNMNDSSSQIDAKEVIDLLEKNPEAAVCLYKLVDTKNYTEDDCKVICKYLLGEKKPLRIISRKYGNVTYAGECKNAESGWKEKEYRINSRAGYPQKMKSLKEKAAFDSKSLRSISERELAMRIFSQGRKEGGIEQIPRLGYILDYEMPIGGKNNKLYRIESSKRYSKEDESYPFGIHIPNESDYLFTTGNCDLIAYDAKDVEFLILELKDMDSKEPLLRAVLEAYTYKQLLKTSEAAKSLKKHYKEIISGEINEIGWRAAPLLYIKGEQHKEYEKIEEKSEMRELMKELNIEPIWYDIKDNKIFICDRKK